MERVNILCTSNIYYFRTKKETICILNIIDRPKGYFSNWNKPYTERLIVYNLIYGKILNYQTHRSMRRTVVVMARDRGKNFNHGQ